MPETFLAAMDLGGATFFALGVDLEDFAGTASGDADGTANQDEAEAGDLARAMARSATASTENRPA